MERTKTITSMAADVNARSNKQATIAFTLPISCQICLGKVKGPVLCPNNHVFCSMCMEIWLQKNKQCPACRTAMTSPRKILGGLSHHEDNPEKLTNPDLRKARFDLLYKEYENEFERMHSEIQLLKTENQILKQQARRDGSQERAGISSDQGIRDTNGLLALTKKLQDATKLYEKVKGELSHLKQENSNLKDENVSLNRENQHLRGELAGRSPHRYGRITVSTLESKLASCEKDISRLSKALERSDKYIEELEAELKSYRDAKDSDMGIKQGAGRGDKYLPNGDLIMRKISSDSKVLPSVENRERTDHSRRQLFLEDDVSSKSSSGEHSKYYYLSNGDAHGREDQEEYMDFENDKNYGRSESARSGANKGQKRVTFDLRNDTNATTSFDLELPSPVKSLSNRSASTNRPASPVKGVLKNGAKKQGAFEKSDDNFSTDRSQTFDDSLSNSYNEKPSRRSELYSKDDDLIYMKARAKSRESRNDPYLKPSRKYSADDSALSEPSDIHSKNSDDLLKRSSDLVKRASDLERYSSGTRRSASGYDRKLDDDSDDIDKVDLDDTIHIESELGDLDISLTPELSDCMKLLNRAEKKVHHRDSDLEEDNITGYKSRRVSDLDTGFGNSASRASDADTALRTSASRSSGIVSDYGQSSIRGSDMDAAFRASTGSYTSRPRIDDFGLDSKTGIESKFASSLDSYSRGRHHRSGSLDNLLVDIQREPIERPGSALPSTSNMYSGLPSSKYTGGLTTGRTKLTRTPSFDNLLMSRQTDGFANKYTFDTDFSGAKSRLSMPGYLSQLPYRGEKMENIDVKASSGTGSTNVADLDTAGSKSVEGVGSHRVDNMKGDGNRTDYDAVLEARSKSLADIGITASSVHGRNSLNSGLDLDKKKYSSGRLDVNMDMDDKRYMSGHAASSLTAHSDVTLLPKSSTDKLSLTGPGAASGRFTPPLPPSTNPPVYSKTNLTNYSHAGSGSSSLPADISHKPPIASRPYDSSKHSVGIGLGSGNSYNSIPSASSSSGGGYSSMPAYSSTGRSSYTNSMDLLPSGTKHRSETGPGSKVNYDSYQPDMNSYISSKPKSNFDERLIDDKFSSASNANNLPVYNANRVDTDNYNHRNSHEYLPKFQSVDQNASKPVLSASDNYSSALPSFTGSSSLASYAATSFLPTSLSSMSSGSSYSTAISVPLTLTTSSYSSSRPSTSYAAKPMDPISEHFSYVSNISGELSKSDTFALPEPKKRLFDSTDDLDMSVSPIKSNKRY